METTEQKSSRPQSFREFVGRLHGSTKRPKTSIAVAMSKAPLGSLLVLRQRGWRLSLRRRQSPNAYDSRAAEQNGTPSHRPAGSRGVVAQGDATTSGHTSIYPA